MPACKETLNKEKQIRNSMLTDSRKERSTERKIAGFLSAISEKSAGQEIFL
jgi:hypothetical protein